MNFKKKLDEALDPDNDDLHWDIHKYVNNNIINPIDALSRIPTSQFDPNRGSELVRTAIKMINNLPYGPEAKIDYKRERQLRDNILVAANTTLSRMPPNELLKFSIKLREFWVSMTL